MVESTGVLLASGSQVALRYGRERVRGTIPTAVGTATISVAAAATSSYGTGYSAFSRASGSFLTDGFIKGQKIRSAGFTNVDNNGDWIVHDVEALTMHVRDPNDLIDNETAASDQTVQILLKTLRGTSRNVNLEKNILESQEVDPDGQETDSRHGFNRVVGAPGFQLNRGDFDDFIEYLMGREWDQGSTIVSTGVNLSVTSVNTTTGQAVIARASGSWITLGFRPGDMVATASFVAGGNNGQRRVLAVSSSNLTVALPSDETMVVATAAAATVTLIGKRIDVGNEMMTFFLERQFQDIDQFQPFKGCAVDQFSLNVEPESMVNGTFNILGMAADAVAGTSVGDVTLSASSNAPYAAFEGEIYEGGERIAVATSCTFTLARNRSLNPIIGSRFSPDVFAGTARCTGTLSAYFDTVELMNKFVNETESSMWFRFDDPNAVGTHWLSVVFPRVKYNGGAIDPPQEGPVTMEMPFRALKATGVATAGGGTRNTLMTIQVSNDLDS